MATAARSRGGKKRTKTVQKNGVSGKTVVRIVLAVVLCAALLGGAVYAAWRLTDGFTRLPWADGAPAQETDELPDGVVPGNIADGYYIELDGRRYGNGGVAPLRSGTEIAVSDKFGAEYTVTMTAHNAVDFAFTLGAEPYTWKNVAGDDFTAGFTVTRTQTGFNIAYGSPAEIISAVKGNTCTIADGAVQGAAELFTMTIAGNGHAIGLNFINAPVGVDLAPGEIVI